MTRMQRVTIFLSLAVTALGLPRASHATTMQKTYCGITHFCVNDCFVDPAAFCANACYGTVSRADCTYIDPVCPGGTAIICSAEE